MSKCWDYKFYPIIGLACAFPETGKVLYKLGNVSMVVFAQCEWAARFDVESILVIVAVFSRFVFIPL